MVNPCRGLGIFTRGWQVFVSTYESAIDAKGRVSIPAPFRAVLGGGSRVFLWPALDGSGCLEGGGEALMQMYRQTLLRLPPKSPARTALVEGIFASAADLKMDDPGRIRLPQDLREAASLSERVVFSGQIDSFQVWEPGRHAEHKALMREQAANPESLQALGEAYDELLRLQSGGFVTGGLKSVGDGEGR